MEKASDNKRVYKLVLTGGERFLAPVRNSG